MHTQKTHAFQKNLHFIVLCFVLPLFFTLSSCSSEETKQPILYDGPLQEGEDILMYYTEKDRVKTLLKAKKIFEYQNGDQEFPEGIYLEFFDELGNITSTLKANDAFYFKEEDKWRGRGNVEVINIEKQQQLNSEELFWKPGTKKIFTDKFVTIKLEKEVLYGTGLEADQDLSNYSMKKIEGDFEVED